MSQPVCYVHLCSNLTILRKNAGYEPIFPRGKADDENRTTVGYARVHIHTSTFPEYN